MKSTIKQQDFAENIAISKEQSETTRKAIQMIRHHEQKQSRNEITRAMSLIIYFSFFLYVHTGKCSEMFPMNTQTNIKKMHVKCASWF